MGDVTQLYDFGEGGSIGMAHKQHCAHGSHSLLDPFLTLLTALTLYQAHSMPPSRFTIRSTTAKSFGAGCQRSAPLIRKASPTVCDTVHMRSVVCHPFTLHLVCLGWASIQSLPRTIELDEDGVRLKFLPIKELQVRRMGRQQSLCHVSVQLTTMPMVYPNSDAETSLFPLLHQQHQSQRWLLPSPQEYPKRTAGAYCDH